MTGSGDPTELQAALNRELEPGELVERTARAVGSTLVLTDRRLLLVRQGARFRPRSGIGQWPIDRDLGFRFGPLSQGSTRLTITGPGRSLSVFIVGGQRDDVEALIAALRQRAFAQDEHPGASLL